MPIDLYCSNYDYYSMLAIHQFYLMKKIWPTKKIDNLKFGLTRMHIQTKQFRFRIFYRINLYKNYAFREFSSCSDPFLECQYSVNLVIHFIRMKSSLILSRFSGPFLLYYAACWSSETLADSKNGSRHGGNPQNA